MSHLRQVGSEVPELRRSRQPLPLWVRSIAFLIGAGGGAGVVTSTAGPTIARFAGVALKADIATLKGDVEANTKAQQTSDRLAAERQAATDKRLDAIEKSGRLTAASLRAINKRLSIKSAPVAPSTETP